MVARCEQGIYAREIAELRRIRGILQGSEHQHEYREGGFLRLIDVDTEMVVQNSRNGSYYRHEGPSGDRARIRPLERFPNGLLIAKSQPTIVDAHLDVVLVAPWDEQLVVEGGKPSQSSDKYAIELAGLEAKLAAMEAEYEALPKDGVGQQSRGSYANKLKATHTRITNIRRGLGDVEAHVFVRTNHTPRRRLAPIQTGAFALQSLVQLPSGLPALVLSSSAPESTVRTRYMNQLIEATVPNPVLRPWSHAYRGTV